MSASFPGVRRPFFSAAVAAAAAAGAAVNGCGGISAAVLDMVAVCFGSLGWYSTSATCPVRNRFRNGRSTISKWKLVMTRVSVKRCRSSAARAACGCSSFLDDRPYLTTDWLGSAQNSSSESSLSWTLLIADEASLPLKSEYFSLSSSESRDSIPDAAAGFAAGFGAGAAAAG
jgi:hypothetical protein